MINRDEFVSGIRICRVLCMVKSREDVKYSIVDIETGQGFSVYADRVLELLKDDNCVVLGAYLTSNDVIELDEDIIKYTDDGRINGYTYINHKDSKAFVIKIGSCIEWYIIVAVTIVRYHDHSEIYISHKTEQKLLSETEYLKISGKDAKYIVEYTSDFSDHVTKQLKLLGIEGIWVDDLRCCKIAAYNSGILAVPNGVENIIICASRSDVFVCDELILPESCKAILTAPTMRPHGADKCKIGTLNLNKVRYLANKSLQDILIDNIHFGESLEKIGSYALSNCGNINITGELRLKYIGKRALFDTGIETLDLRKCDLDKLDDEVFTGFNSCTLLLPYGLNNINMRAFVSNCVSRIEYYGDTAYISKGVQVSQIGAESLFVFHKDLCNELKQWLAAREIKYTVER